MNKIHYVEIDSVITANTKEIMVNTKKLRRFRASADSWDMEAIATGRRSKKTTTVTFAITIIIYPEKIDTKIGFWHHATIEKKSCETPVNLINKFIEKAAIAIEAIETLDN